MIYKIHGAQTNQNAISQRRETYYASTWETAGVQSTPPTGAHIRLKHTGMMTINPFKGTRALYELGESRETRSFTTKSPLAYPART